MHVHTCVHSEDRWLCQTASGPERGVALPKVTQPKRASCRQHGPSCRLLAGPLPALFTFSCHSLSNCTVLMHFQCKKKNPPTVEIQTGKPPPLAPVPASCICGRIHTPSIWTQHRARSGSLCFVWVSEAPWALWLGSLTQKPSWKFSMKASDVFHWVLCFYFQTLKKFY